MIAAMTLTITQVARAVKMMTKAVSELTADGLVETTVWSGARIAAELLAFRAVELILLWSCGTVELILLWSCRVVGLWSSYCQGVVGLWSSYCCGVVL